jgi:hypothetical protein
MTTPHLLNDDGTASMATALMMSHHAFRRDLRCFARALESLDTADTAKLAALRQEWQWFRGALHGHHQSEDSGVFPHMKTEHPEVAATIDGLSAEHRLIDPLLDDGDAAFGAAFDLAGARGTIATLLTLLTPHLAKEEAELIPFLRDAKQFPAPTSDEMAVMYAQGFGWASYGIAPEVLAQVDKMLPEAVSSRMPQSRADFAARVERSWGAPTPATSTTPVPG